MELSEEIKHYRKEAVFEKYVRIIFKFKTYDKITKVKMLDEIFKFYNDDYNNIINICTERELKFLEKVVSKKVKLELYTDSWEYKNLYDKFLVNRNDFGNYLSVPQELKENIKKALKNVNYAEKREKDKLDEILIGFCKTHGSILLQAFLSVGTMLVNLGEEELYNHIKDDALFNYYLYKDMISLGTTGKKIDILICHDYYEIEDELEEERNRQGLNSIGAIDIKKYVNIFYHDFDIDNPKIKKLLDEINKYPILKLLVLNQVKDFAMLNIDRKPLKDYIEKLCNNFNYSCDLTYLYRILDEAMDEMPSGALNGLTPNEAKEYLKEKKKVNDDKKKYIVKQKDAALNKKDANLFYKIYFALLEFTNIKYNINKNLKIYKAKRLNPNDLMDITEKYWENSKLITDEFCSTNPYKFSEEELSITKEFVKGKRDVYAIYGFEEEYALFLGNDKVYMVKGINCNLDKVLNPITLPFIAKTTVLPFKGVLIYDSLFSSFDVSIGEGMIKRIYSDAEKCMKYYHL